MCCTLKQSRHVKHSYLAEKMITTTFKEPSVSQQSLKDISMWHDLFRINGILNSAFSLVFSLCIMSCKMEWALKMWMLWQWLLFLLIVNCNSRKSASHIKTSEKRAERGEAWRKKTSKQMWTEKVQKLQVCHRGVKLYIDKVMSPHKRVLWKH